MGTDGNGKLLWYGDECVGLKLAVAGWPQGESVLEGKTEKGAFSLSIYISPEEAEKIAEMVGQ